MMSMDFFDDMTLNLDRVARMLEQVIQNHSATVDKNGNLSRNGVDDYCRNYRYNVTLIDVAHEFVLGLRRQMEEEWEREKKGA